MTAAKKTTGQSKYSHVVHGCVAAVCVDGNAVATARVTSTTYGRHALNHKIQEAKVPSGQEYKRPLSQPRSKLLAFNIQMACMGWSKKQNRKFIVWIEELVQHDQRPHNCLHHTQLLPKPPKQQLEFFWRGRTLSKIAMQVSKWKRAHELLFIGVYCRKMVARSYLTSRKSTLWSVDGRGKGCQRSCKDSKTAYWCFFWSNVLQTHHEWQVYTVNKHWWW